VNVPVRKHLDRVLDGAAREFYARLERGELATTRCCEQTAFPPRMTCPRCGGEPQWVEIPRRGRLEAFTTQESAVRFAAPAVLALARIDGAVLPGIADSEYDDLRIGDEVRVELRAHADLGLTLLWFVPLD
jgi:uncharacterized OB-fold protein